MPRTNLSIILLTSVISLVCYQRASQTRYAATVADAMSQIDLHFVDPIDRRQLFEASMEGMISQLDPYSGYINPEEYVRLQEEIEQHFGGVGIVIDFEPETNRPVILSARPGAPAFRAGIRAGDIITAIDGQDAGKLGAEGPIKLIRGQPGTQVTLAILSHGDEEPHDVVITRDVIPIESVMGYQRDEQQNWIYRLPDHPNIGYVWIESFGEETSTELANALREIEDVDALVVDVRTNAGGILTAAVEVCDMFIPDGPIVTIRGRYTRREKKGKTGNERFPIQKPMVVLADRYSASAAEIFASCIQDHDRGIVIGERTWGKGTVQSVLEMEGGQSALRLTTATYWRPSGTNIHRRPDSKDDDTWGVQPNEGFQIKYDDDVYVRFLRSRSNRFAGSDPTKNEPRDAEDAPFVDTQLQRAIEYLDSPLTIPNQI